MGREQRRLVAGAVHDHRPGSQLQDGMQGVAGAVRREPRLAPAPCPDPAGLRAAHGRRPAPHARARGGAVRRVTLGAAIAIAWALALASGTLRAAAGAEPAPASHPTLRSTRALVA